MNWKHIMTALAGAVAIGQAGNLSAKDLMRLGSIQEISGTSLIIRQQAFRLSDNTIIHLPGGETATDRSSLAAGTRIRLRADSVEGGSVPRIEEIWIVTE